MRAISLQYHSGHGAYHIVENSSLSKCRLFGGIGPTTSCLWGLGQVMEPLECNCPHLQQGSDTINGLAGLLCRQRPA